MKLNSEISILSILFLLEKNIETSFPCPLSCFHPISVGGSGVMKFSLPLKLGSLMAINNSVSSHFSYQNFRRRFFLLYFSVGGLYFGNPCQKLIEFFVEIVFWSFRSGMHFFVYHPRKNETWCKCHVWGKVIHLQHFISLFMVPCLITLKT